ncbi:MAG: carbohydrate binding family 9 domain-containing protein [bacterium]|nr:carbohydrate binding family 9 domain-containing protein [bacterium]
MKRAMVMAVLLVVTAGSQAYAASSDYVIEVPLLSAAPTLDGHLSEAVWEEAPLLDHFVQIDPDEGAPATERTEVRIGYDAKKLYLGVRCHYSEPDRIHAITMERDQRLFHDDTISFVLDTFLDRTSGYYFAVTALGAQNDALVRRDGNDVSLEWDGIWDVATSRDADGWTAEIAIPFRTLRFPQKEVQSWGFNIHRYVVFKRETLTWKPMARSLGIDSSLRVGQAGELTGMRNLEQGRQLDIVPHAVTRWEEGDDGDDTSLEVGVDVKKNLTSELVLDLTYNLDFAEAEADRQQTNLTRFKLYFPEKRDFFLEGANLFHFGERQDYQYSPDKLFFFSRRIGLTEDGDHEIPVLGGVKLSGKLGGTGIGLLNLTTEDLTYTDSSGNRRVEPRTNYTVLRMRRNVLAKSAVGLMWLNQAVDGDLDNSGAGVDWDFAFGDHVQSAGYLAKTSTPGIEGEDWAGLVDVLWDSKSFFMRSVYSEIGENFNPQMGFFTRLGVSEFRTTFAADVRPEKWGLRNIEMLEDFIYITNSDGDVESQFNRLSADIVWNNLVIVAVKIFDEIEVLEVNFEIDPGVIIPPGEYHFQHYFIGAQTIPSKPVFAFARIYGGEFYDGDSRSFFLGLRLRPMPGFTTQVTWEHNDVDLPGGEFDIDLMQGRISYSLSPRLSLRGLLQWKRDDNFDAQILCQWIYKPGAAFYVVYDEFRDLKLEPHTRDRALIVKLSHLF